ncbi:hypothetical protein T12_14921 [Trichinella patagoniensis]|uniref:Uncharacterized protein n=1 Tax=Trichinella patagoniensis TaxID=990121 RepID=A0A0V0YZJ8_9BILA|nr:hypothetical protein T12_14921 [Trichinella patagoniensis]
MVDQELQFYVNYGFSFLPYLWKYATGQRGSKLIVVF